MPEKESAKLVLIRIYWLYAQKYILTFMKNFKEKYIFHSMETVAFEKHNS